uniref:oxidoreductase n=1 Tax=Rhodococcus qingshengii TaxID=334542 RepID=UPI001C4DE956|nr:12-oxophytodienoate reductase [Rhodococcus qingshengii]
MERSDAESSPRLPALFKPIEVRSLTLANRIVMSPMTRAYSPGGVPGPDVVEYYRRRAAGGTGLIVTEGVAIDHPTAVDHPDVPRLHGNRATDGWRKVVDAVHAEGGKIIPQLWHVGPLWGAMSAVDPELRPMRPSGLWGTPGLTSYTEDYIARAVVPTSPMNENDIDLVIDAYVRAASLAMKIGFDGIAMHGGHGYLLDSFFWSDTNRRDDQWGGDVERRAHFPAEVVRAVRAEVGDDTAIIYRFSQHKQQDYTARIAQTQEELSVLLNPLVKAGVDILDASIRNFDSPAFAGSSLSLAGWAKQVTGAVTMAVGSVGIGATLRESLTGTASPTVDNLAVVERRMTDEEFDLIAIGRLHLADPALAGTLRAGHSLPVFDRKLHEARLH